MHRIVQKVEKYSIPPSLIINIDQTPTKYVPVSKSTLAKKGTKHIPITSSNDKRMITATFSETLDGKFLSLQLIYKGKTKRSFPDINFPAGFSKSANEKYHSNTHETIKKALVVWDVFRGQTTADVTDVLVENNITTEYVPYNLTVHYQPLDCTTNKWAKDFTKRKFSNWYAKQIREQLAQGVPLEEIDINFQLTRMKPLHAQWMIELYYELSTAHGKDIIIKGWKQSGIFDAINLGSAGLPSLDPFEDVDPLDSLDSFSLFDTPLSATNYEYDGDSSTKEISEEVESDDSEWDDVDFDYGDGNAFDNFDVDKEIQELFTESENLYSLERK